MSTPSTSSQCPYKEYVVRVPKTLKKKYHMMRFNSEHGTDFFKNWSQCRMERENRKFLQHEEEMPKFGAGSEYGREAREEARRKRYGINIRKAASADKQPWKLNIGGKGGKKFRGVREGGVAENAAWFVFMQGKDGSFEAYPIDEWYNFHTSFKYKSLSAEEAEKEFERRDKIMNFFQVMYEKKLKKDVNDPEEDEVGPGKKSGGKRKKDLVLSEMDDWVSDDEEEDRDEEDGEISDDGRKKKKPKGKKKGQGGKKAKKIDAGSDDSCIEESDEFDEGQEQDYISGDSSDSDHMNEEVASKELAGVEEDEALKKLLASDESSDEEKKDEEKTEEEKNKEEAEGGEKKKKKKKKKDKKNDKESDKSPATSGDESKANKDEVSDERKKAVNDLKRKVKANPHEMLPAKKARMDSSITAASASVNVPTSSASSNMVISGGDTGVTEDAIRRYLMRKPMTTTELLQKFKSKKTGLSSEQLVQSIAQILKRVNPVKQMVQGKMYLSIKTTT